ncbi:MAG: NAD(P)-binding domain-containing protein, partial [Deltaproteobacteria bacterium]
MRIAIVGLGKMGLNMARRLVGGGHEVVGYDRASDRAKEAQAHGIKAVCSLKELAGALPRPRAAWIMVPAGGAVDDAIDGLKGYLDKGDIIIDGGNSFYKDGIRRSGELEKQGIEYLDAGV